ncbi:MAG: NAD(+) diphosphatase [Dactylosporangium sp.]|nr:NAD(+) diphosphatase [Dactylosporangium sp.]NNJ63100.1 NAD(+) diphosphatase [Dactylosporangium sp.]
MTRLPLASGGLDRAAYRRRDPGWLTEAWSRSRVLVLSGGKALVTGEGGQDDKIELALCGPADVPADAERSFLGVDGGGVPYFAAVAPLPHLDGTRPRELREVGHVLGDRDGCLFATGLALTGWHSRSRYSPVSGKPTAPAEAGWTRVTADAGETLWPRTDPAAIVLVHDGQAGPAGRCLLARNAAWPLADGLPRYSCLAGFVEPGESAEQAVVREVQEEIGLVVREVRYVASQPWPFPGSLMLGFLARADPAMPVIPDQEEITDARWFTRTEISAALAGEPADFGLPMGLSIARYLMARWETAATEAAPPTPA